MNGYSNYILVALCICNYNPSLDLALPHLALGPLHHPLEHEGDLLGLGIADGQGREEVRRDIDGLVGEQAVLVPVVHGAGDQLEGLAGGAGAVVRCGVEGRRVRRRWPPWVLLAVDDGQAWVRDVEASVAVDAVYVRRRGDVEGLDACDAHVLQSAGAGDQRELVLGSTGAGLEEAPFRADLYSC
jgi:hypothetical protein